MLWKERGGFQGSLEKIHSYLIIIDNLAICELWKCEGYNDLPPIGQYSLPQVSLVIE